MTSRRAEKASSGRNVLALLAAVAAWLAAAGPPGHLAVARWIGMLLFHLTAALLIRWIVSRRQVPRPSLWSPWLFVVAAGVALLGRFGSA
jgi:hypothetical protein